MLLTHSLVYNTLITRVIARDRYILIHFVLWNRKKDMIGRILSQAYSRFVLIGIVIWQKVGEKVKFDFLSISKN